MTMITTREQMVQFCDVAELAATLHPSARISICATLSDEMVALTEEFIQIAGSLPSGVQLMKNVLGLPVHTISYTGIPDELTQPITEQDIDYVWAVLPALTSAITKADFAFGVGVNTVAIEADTGTVLAIQEWHAHIGDLHVTILNDTMAFVAMPD